MEERWPEHVGRNVNRTDRCGKGTKSELISLTFFP